MIKPTSRTALKQQCLILSNLDVDKAEKMYDFLVKDITGLPDVDPAARSFIETFGEHASSVLSWFRENQDMLSQGADLIRGIASKRNVVPSSNPLPPIE